MEYPGITKASLAMAYDNGIINRNNSEQEFLKTLDTYLRLHWLHADYIGTRTLLLTQLTNIDRWLDKLDPATLNIICCGDQDEAEWLTARAPPGTRTLLNEIFEDVL